MTSRSRHRPASTRTGARWRSIYHGTRPSVPSTYPAGLGRFVDHREPDRLGSSIAPPVWNARSVMMRIENAFRQGACKGWLCAEGADTAMEVSVGVMNLWWQPLSSRYSSL